MPRSGGQSRAGARLDGKRLARVASAALGAAIRNARKRRGWSQRELGVRVGLTHARVGQIERNEPVATSLEVWFSIGDALGLPFKVGYGRDQAEEPDDAGHLAIQELCLRLGRQTGRARAFELRTKPANPSVSIDVCLRDDVQRVLVIEECWNSFGNINASVRSTRQKVAEAQELAVAVGGDRGPYRVAACWVVRDTRRNREILGRYPEVFASAFTGSSSNWVKALTRPGASPPAELGLVWCDLRATRVFAWRG